MYTFDETRSLTALLFEHSRREDTGLYFDRASGTPDFISYAALLRISCRIGDALETGGMRPGDELVMQVEDNKLFICIFWACLIKGVIPVPLAVGLQDDFKQKAWQVWKCLANPYIACSVRQREHLEAYPALREEAGTGVSLEGRAFTGLHVLLEETALSGPDSYESTNDQQDQLAFIQFSSGSTGSPKGVMLTHANVVANIAAMIRRLKITPADTMLSWVPLTHDMGLVLAHLMSTVVGINQFIVPTDSFRRRPLQWMQKVSRSGATLLYANNFGIKYFSSLFEGTQDYDWDLSSVRIIFNAGEPVSADVANHFLRQLSRYRLSPAAMLPCYGMAEASVGLTFGEPGGGMIYYNISREHAAIGCAVRYMPEGSTEGAITVVDVGAALDNVQLQIVDDAGLVLPPEHVGHIYMKGPNVTSGYYRNEEATGAAKRSGGWMYTGDIGFLTAEGRLVITGRAKNVIIINGHNYYPQDIETIAEKVVALEKPVIVACGVTPGADLQEQLLIFVVFRGALSDFIPLAAAIRRTILEQVGLNVLHVIPVKKVPKTTSGKVQYFKLRESFLEGLFDHILRQMEECAEAAPAGSEQQDTTERILSKVREVVMDNSLAAEDPLFSDSVNSLLLIQISGFIQSAYGVKLPAEDFFNGLTTAAIAERVRLAGAVLQVAGERDAAATLPLSHTQKRLWYIHYEGEEYNTAYNNVLSYTINGPLSIPALTIALEQLIARYEILRTNFFRSDNGPEQVISDPADYQPYFRHVLLAEGEALESVAAALVMREKEYGFDLQQDRLLRTHLLSKDDHTHVCVFNIHHIITDAWSLRIFLEALSNTYNAVIEGQPAGTLPAGPQYRDYVLWHQQWINSREGGQSRHFWKEKLSAAPAGLDLPGAKKRPVYKTYHGATIYQRFEGTEYEKIRAFCFRQEVSHFMLLLATLKLLVYKYTGAQDIIVGAPAYGHAGFQDQIGLFINMLPLRTQLEPGESFTTLLERVKSVCLEVYEHHQYPFDLILQDLYLTRDSSRSPLFDIMVSFNHEHLLKGRVLHWQGTTVEPFPMPRNYSQYDLDFEFDQLEDKLELRLSYNTDIFENAPASRILEHFCTLLSLVVEQPQQQLGRFNYLSEQELQRILERSRGPVGNYDLSGSYIQYFEKQLLHYRDRVALVHNERAFTLGELEERASRIGWYLRQHRNIRPNDRVAVLLNRSAEFAWWVLGIWKAGGAYVPVDPGLPVSRIRHMLNISGASCLIVDHEDLLQHEELINEGFTAKAVYIGQVEQEISSCPATPPGNYAAPADLAYVLFTSGSTGEPKGVMVTHLGMLNHMFAFIEHFEMDEHTRMAQNASQSFDVSVWQFFTTMLTGGTVYVYDQLLVYHPHGFVQRLRDDRISILEVVPSYLKVLLDEEWNGVGGNGSLRYLIVTGEEIKPALAQRALMQLPESIRLMNTYGPAEAADNITLQHITPATVGETVPVGRPLFNTNVYIVDEAGNLCAFYVKGEICVSGAGVGKGYINNEELTASVFGADPFTAGERMYRTGDIGYMDEEGRVHFLCRRDNQVKIRGYRIELGEIERVMTRIEGVREAIVLAKNVGGTSPAILAFFIGTADTAGIKKALAAALPGYMMPAQFTHLEEWPLNSNGKTDRKALLQMAVTDFVPANVPDEIADELEQQLAVLWRKVLPDNPRVERQSNFFELGGHSLSAMQLIQLVRKIWRIQLNLNELFRLQVLEVQAAFIREGRMQAVENIPLQPAKEYYEVSDEQRRFLISDELDKDSYTNNAVGGICIEGSIDPELLKAACSRLIERHEILRSVIVKAGYDYKFSILPAGEIISDMRITRIGNTQPAAEVVANIARAEAMHVFDVSRPPLVRWHLIEQGPDKYVLLVTLHHVIADGWSLVVIFRELLQIYQALRTSGPVQPGAVEIQYKDYAAWFNSRIPVLYEQDNFWKDYLRLPLPLPSMPLDFPRTGRRLCPAANNVFVMDPLLLQAIKAMAVQEGVTPFIVLLSAIHVLLYKYNNSQEQLVAIPVAGRDHPQLQHQIGLYFKLLPLRSSLSGEMSFKQLLTQIQEYMIEILEHPYPYDYFTDHLKLSRPGRSGLYDVMVMHQAVDLGPIPPGLHVYPYLERAFDDKTDCDLRFDLIEHRGELTVAINYNTSLFRQSSIQVMEYRMINILKQLLAGTGDVLLSSVELDLPGVPEHGAFFENGSGDAVFADDFRF